MTKTSSTTIDNLTRQIEAYGFNGFLDATDTRLKLLSPESADHVILSYLRKNAVGAVNAKSWEEINAHLKSLKYKMTKNYFQTNLLKHSRRNLYFIGSNHRGFFLLQDDNDIMATNAFYDGRIAKESENRNTLKFLASKLPVVEGLDGDRDVPRSGSGSAPGILINPSGSTDLEAGPSRSWPN